MNSYRVTRGTINYPKPNEDYLKKMVRGWYRDVLLNLPILTQLEKLNQAEQMYDKLLQDKSLCEQIKSAIDESRTFENWIWNELTTINEEYTKKEISDIHNDIRLKIYDNEIELNNVHIANDDIVHNIASELLDKHGMENCIGCLVAYSDFESQEHKPQVLLKLREIILKQRELEILDNIEDTYGFYGDVVISEELQQRLINEIKFDLEADWTITEVTAVDWSDGPNSEVDYQIYYAEDNEEFGYSDEINMPSCFETAPPLTAKTVMGSAPDNTEPSSEMEM